MRSNSMEEIFSRSKELIEILDSMKGVKSAGLALKLKPSECKGFTISEIVTQIECRERTRKKLSAFLESGQFLFPDLLASEQATDQKVALYHASKIGSGKRVADMTAGLGIDSMTIAMKGNHVSACEMLPGRFEALRYNSSSLGIKNLVSYEGDSIEWLKQQPNSSLDYIFIDPARRDDANRRTYFLSDCVPDVTRLADLMLSKASTVLIKASPIMDVSKIARDLPNVSAIEAISINNECKEILITLKRNAESDIIKRAIEIGKEKISLCDLKKPDFEIATESVFDSSINKDFGRLDNPPIAEPDEIRAGTYLYEPNSSVQKLNFSSELCETFHGLKKLAPNTSLYWSREYFCDFPGRKLLIEELPNRKRLQQLGGSHLNVATRNFPLRPEEIRKKYKLKEGEDLFLYGARVGTESLTQFIIARKK